MHFTNLDLLLLLLTTLQCATDVFCRSYGDAAHIDASKLTTNAARMRAGFPPLKPKNLNIPSRGKMKYFILYSFQSHLPALFFLKSEREIHCRQHIIRMC
jgi:hypothetical protein